MFIRAVLFTIVLVVMKIHVVHKRKVNKMDNIDWMEIDLMDRELEIEREWELEDLMEDESCNQ